MARAISLLLVAVVSVLWARGEAGVIKDLFQKITNTNNQTVDVVKQSSPVCGSGIFSTPNENSISPEIIFITNRQSRGKFVHSSPDDRYESNGPSRRPNRNRRANEVAKEFRFHMENVTLEELERNGFNRDAPVTFLMHGFTSGYPLQAWISAIVEAYTIDRETSSHGSQSESHQNGGYHTTDSHHQGDSDQSSQYRRREDYGQAGQGGGERGERVKHNLFIINWNYAARGIIYPRAVANIPKVASYATRFINDKLLGEANMDPRRIQLIGHSLGAHLAGFIGKNTRSKLGRIYGLDPAGPCFGALSGPLYPSSQRLAPSDAEEVITIHTNTALLGIDKPIGRYSVFVEGGAVQPGCKGGTVLKSISTLTFDGGDFDTVACSHSRAPNLLTHRIDQSDSQDDCQMVAYECKDWDSYTQGKCGVCHSDGVRRSQSDTRHDEALPRPVDCLRVGLDWQYPKAHSTSSGAHDHRETEWQRPHADEFSTSTTEYPSQGHGNRPTRRPTSSPSYEEYNNDKYNENGNGNGYNNSNNQNWRTSTRRPERHQDYHEKPVYGSSGSHRSTSTRRPDYSLQRERRALLDNILGGRQNEQSVEAKKMYLRTGDTQPYCTYQYQVVLELNEPFAKRAPPMAMVLQDSVPNKDRNQESGTSERRGEQNSISVDDFGHEYSNRVYTKLLSSAKKLKRIDHATLLFRTGLPDGQRILKALHVNYMSHADPDVRQKLSSKLCLVKTDMDRRRDEETRNRFYFEPCEGQSSSPGRGDRDESHNSSFGYSQDRSASSPRPAHRNSTQH